MSYPIDNAVPKWQDSDVIPPEDCVEMREIRAGIDYLDRKLIALIAQRLTYIERAGEIKPTRDTVRDEARIEDVITKVLVESKKHGLPQEIAEPVWRLMVEKCIAHEFVVFDERAPSDVAETSPIAATR